MIPAGNAHSEGVEELLRQMTSEERISLLSTKSIAIERLNLTSFNWWTGATMLYSLEFDLTMVQYPSAVISWASRHLDGVRSR